MSAWDDDHRFAVDTVGAAFLALWMVPLAQGGMGYSSTEAQIATTAMVVPLAWRRTRPTLSAVLVLSAALLHFLLMDDLVVPGDLLVLVSLYSVTVHGPVWAYRTAIVGVITGSGMYGASFLRSAGWGSWESAVGTAFLLSLVSLTVFAFGLVRRARRERIETLVDRAQRLEVERDQQARIATAAERARIAREMHDIVAHSLSVIIAQADGGRYAAAQDPAAATRSLTTISETGRAALADMRRLLGVLRPATEPDPQQPETPQGRDGGPAELAPQPVTRDIDQLVEQVRSSGVRISLVRMGTPRALPPGTELTVFRICQESLTNILKHAGPSPSATVLLQWERAALVLQVSDDGRGAAAGTDGAGQGVLGMRERAAMLGGSLTAGPRPGGGYRVRAEIPIPALDQQGTEAAGDVPRP
ncbi:sensor histidine kinase [Cellulomonas bogoriensis]|uniref:sensor histidine kinase n=1 Tax=Cellulomonas bogoriensis TaxID=301388 RepID=UPI000B23C229|nr:histidine kinase [Cellulomonas bogoriensis]